MDEVRAAQARQRVVSSVQCMMVDIFVARREASQRLSQEAGNVHQVADDGLEVDECQAVDEDDGIGLLEQEADDVRSVISISSTDLGLEVFSVADDSEEDER
eukprot:11206739-Karenia_brevis.AAC.1